VNKAHACQFVAVLAIALAPRMVQAQALIIPQIADGGGWQTTLVLTNTSASAATGALSFFSETSNGATQPWNPPFLEGVSVQNLSISGGGTLILHTSGSSGATTVGWAQLQGRTAIVAYAIFTQRVPGRQDQDGTAVASTSATRVLVPFDNTNGFVTTIAIVNPNASSESVSVGIESSSGSVSQLSPITLPAQGHTSFAMPQQFSATGGQSGLAEFYSASGTISVLALRFNPTGAFTTAPVYAQTGSPIIGTGGTGTPGGGGTLPQFSQIIIHASPSGTSPGPGLASYPQLGITQILVESFGSTSGSYPVGIVEGVILSATGIVPGQYAAYWNNVTVSGQTLTFSGLQVTGSTMEDSSGNIAQITTATLTVTLSPQGAPTSGTVTGSMTLSSTLATVSGSFTGTYIAQN
jgi:hypothetical protein